MSWAGTYQWPQCYFSWFTHLSCDTLFITRCQPDYDNIPVFHSNEKNYHITPAVVSAAPQGLFILWWVNKLPISWHLIFASVSLAFIESMCKLNQLQTPACPKNGIYENHVGQDRTHKVLQLPLFRGRRPNRLGCRCFWLFRLHFFFLWSPWFNLFLFLLHNTSSGMYKHTTISLYQMKPRESSL